MAIPHENIIKDIVLKHLYTKREEVYSIKSDDMYFELISEVWHGTEELTYEEINERYQQSISKWANAVQWAVKHLKDEGLLLPTNVSGRGIWNLSKKGIEEAKRRWKEINDGEDYYENTVKKSAREYLENFELEMNLENFSEGNQKIALTSKYERNPKLRAKAIEIHGLICKVCGFEFEKIYGELGANFIEVHHLTPLSNIKAEHEVNPESDMTVLCANCHRMMHRSRNEILTVEELQSVVKNQEK